MSPSSSLRFHSQTYISPLLGPSIFTMSQPETITILQDVITKTQPQPILKKDLQDMHDHILSQPGGEDTIRLLGKHMSQNTTVTTMSLGNGAGAFKAKTSAKGNLLNLWFYQRVNIQANGKDFTANMGGFTPGIPVGALFGDLYYDDINDISGDYDVQVGGIMVSCSSREHHARFADSGYSNISLCSSSATGRSKCLSRLVMWEDRLVWLVGVALGLKRGENFEYEIGEWVSKFATVSLILLIHSFVLETINLR
jgi:hypothetical protein